MKDLKDMIQESLVNEAKEKFYIWQEDEDWYGTNEKNAGARIKNAREILTFAARNGFETADDVKDYIKKYFKADLDIEVLDKRP